MKPELSDAIVFFGATGDLAYKKVFPALQAMVRHRHLDVPVVGVAKSGWNLEQFKARGVDSLEKHGGVDKAACTKLLSLLRYVDGDYADAATFERMRAELCAATRPLFYLAIPPSAFPVVVDGLAKVGCHRHARVVVEKPFGRDLASARKLNRTLRRHFPEQAIFRIDHYLGKEPVQNLLYFRFANPLIEAGWNNRHLESVQITMAESFGVQGRGKLYEEVGAIRDVIQNHMLQVIACLAMECPVDADHESLRDERARVLRSVSSLDPSSAVRGQFCGYRDEPGVAADSQIETYAAVRFHIDNDRWAGVPFCVRVGKCMPVTTTQVVARFQRRARPVLDETDAPQPNYCRFRLSPETVIAVGTMMKKPGEEMVGEPLELIAHHQEPDEMDPYERLLGDAAAGITTLFAREDAVESSWRIVAPILDGQAPLYDYEPGTWGPVESQGAVAPKGGWIDPASGEAG